MRRHYTGATMAMGLLEVAYFSLPSGSSIKIHLLFPRLPSLITSQHQLEVLGLVL